MAKTKRQIAEDLRLIDVVIEIRDARIPVSSQNPDMKELIKSPINYTLNKYPKIRLIDMFAGLKRNFPF